MDLIEFVYNAFMDALVVETEAMNKVDDSDFEDWIDLGGEG